MLQEIHIQNYAVIESLRLDFHPGLNVLTGETGSGKSIVVDALALALGGRASPDVIRTGAGRATVTAVFGADSHRGDNHRAGNWPWSKWLDHYGVGGGSGTEIMLRREVQAGGRSRLLVNDEPVTLAAAKDLAPLLVEVHGQGEHAALVLREAQLELLDAFAQTEDRLAEVRAHYGRRKELEREWAEFNQSEQERLRALDLLRFQVD
jgi:DNA repair protein RecN (Recombination protein N)